MKKIISILIALFIVLFAAPAFSEGESALYDDMSYRDSDKEVLDRFEKGEFSDEVYYLASNAVGWGGGEYDIAVFLRDGNPVVVIYESDYKCQERTLSREEYNSFVKTIEEIDADNLPLWDTYMVDDGTEHEYIHITNEKKVSVYMNNVGFFEEVTEAKKYISLIEAFEALVKDKEFKTYYRIKGTELLINSEDYKVYSVYKDGDDFRVLLKENSGKYQWYYFKDGKIDTKADEPEGFTIANAWDNIDDSIYYEHLNNYPWQTTWGKYVVKLSRSGICLTKEGEKPKLICNGTFSRGVVIPDTDFLVCEEATKGWANPRKMVVINLMTGEKKDAPFPESDSVTPLLILNSKLLFSCNNRAEKKNTYYFYDVVNDTIEEAEGDFYCLSSSVGEGRFLQKASMENKYFTMYQNFSIGFFDTKTYKYTELEKVPFLLFSNEEFWIDEAEGKIYMVADNNLISYPIEVDFSIADDIRVSVNEKKLQFDTPPYIKNDRTMVPMRAIFEALGAEVSWDNNTRTAIGVKDGIEVKITIGENVLYKNGEAIELDCAAEITNDRTMVPVRAISEAFGCRVDWDNDTKTVNVLDLYNRTSAKAPESVLGEESVTSEAIPKKTKEYEDWFTQREMMGAYIQNKIETDYGTIVEWSSLSYSKDEGSKVHTYISYVRYDGENIAIKAPMIDETQIRQYKTLEISDNGKEAVITYSEHGNEGAVIITVDLVNCTTEHSD